MVLYWTEGKVKYIIPKGILCRGRSLLPIYRPYGTLDS